MKSFGTASLVAAHKLCDSNNEHVDVRAENSRANKEIGTFYVKVSEMN